MATVAALNVAIGAEIKGLERGIRDAESALRKANTRLSAAGDALTRSLSLGIAGFGVAAITSAGQMEALKKAMEATFLGAGRSVGEARAEVDALRKAAEAPGLDFEQAVKASLRLQGVGFSAEKARGTIVQLANAIASTGGTAENLNGVTIQFAQMISKGKILTSDLNVIKENMPGLAKIMQDTFGTTTAEGLRDLGINGKQFVEQITAAMEKLPRVEGGISNSIVNAGTAIKMFLADVGESLNKTFNISGRLDEFSKWLGDLGTAFSKTSDSTKNLVAGIGVFALALGPALKAGNLMIQMSGAVVAGFDAMKVAGLKIKNIGLAAWFREVDTASKLTTLGVVIGVVLAAALAFRALQTDMSASAQAARAVEEVGRTAAEAIAGQKSQVDVLVNAYKGEFTSLEAKKDILNQLKQISPEYFGTLKVGKGDVDALTAATALYSAELLRVAKITAAKDKIVELEKAMLNLGETANPTIWQTAGNAILSFGSGADFAGRQIATGSKNIMEQQKALEAQRDALMKVVTADAIANATAPKKIQNIKTEKENIDDLAKSYAALDKAARVTKRKTAEENVRNFRKKGDSPTVSSADAKQGSVTSTATPGRSDIAADMNKAVEAQNRYLAKLKEIQTASDIMSDLRDGTISFGEAWKRAADIIEASSNTMQKAAFAATGAAQQYAEKGGSSLKEMGQAALAAGAKVVRSYIMQGVASAVSKALQSVPFPFNLIAAGAAGAVAGTLFNKLLGALKIPAMAVGGRAPGGLTLVGERGAELVNLPGGSHVLPNHRTMDMLKSSGGSDINISGNFRVQGTDLILVLEKAQKQRGRVNGQ